MHRNDYIQCGKIMQAGKYDVRTLTLVATSVEGWQCLAHVSVSLDHTIQELIRSQLGSCRTQSPLSTTYREWR